MDDLRTLESMGFTLPSPAYRHCWRRSTKIVK
jgi:hypothetical protein